MVRIVQMVALGANAKQGFWVEVLSADRFDLVEDMITIESLVKHFVNTPWIVGSWVLGALLFYY